MKYIFRYAAVSLLSLACVNCSDYLNTSSPANSDDEFVTSTIFEARKVMSWAYANYRQSCLMGTYAWNDPLGSDVEHYPEQNSSNNANARLKPQALTVNAASGGFNNLYSTLARAAKLAAVIEGKEVYQSAVAAGQQSDWVQLHAEAVVLKALCYFDLVKHFGDVPYGLENANVTDYELTSRFYIYDEIIAMIKEVEPLMYTLGENGVTAEYVSKSYANALMGMAALWSGGWQTIRRDIDIYGDVQFSTKGEEYLESIYARRTDYLDYYRQAETFFQAALDSKGTADLITADERTYANNPFQRHFQYLHDLKVSPESIFEAGVYQGNPGNGAQTNEFGYAFGRPSKGGGTNAAPPKVFGAVRIVPSFYYGEWEAGDTRRDVTAVVTGNNGDGNEYLIPFSPGNTASGGISINKWDMNRMNPPYVTSQRQSGINWMILRMADLILMQAEVKAELGKDADAMTLINRVRSRAFGDSSHNISGLTGDALKDAVWRERKFEFVGEGQVRWDMIRSGKFNERAIDVQQDMAALINGLKTNGYYTFANNGNTMSNYIFTKMVKLDNPLTYDPDPADPALYPGWRGQYDYTKIAAVAGKVIGTDHNVAIKGLFEYIDPSSAEATALIADGYTQTAWGATLVASEATYKENILSGITSNTIPPIYYWPIPYETLSQSKGKVTNGYGLPQQ